MIKVLFTTLLALSAVNCVSVQLGDDPQCDFCTSGLAELKVVLQDAQTKDLIKVLKAEICANVPITDCDAWISAKIADFDKQVEALDPKATCVKLGACAAHVSRSTLVQDDSIPCDFCSFFGAEFQKFILTNETEELILSVVQKICHVLPLGSEQCSSLATEYGKYYMDLLIQEYDVAKLCEALHLCNEDVRNMIASSEWFQTFYQHVKDDEGCKACIDGMDIIRDILNSTDMKDLLHMGIKELLTAVGLDQYEEVVDDLLDEALENYLPMFKPDEVCKEIGACPAVVAVVEEVADVSVTPACEICTDALGELKKMINDPDTKVQIKAGVEFLCTKMEIPFCDSIMEKLVASTLEKIEALDVQATCTSIEACTAFAPLARLLKVENVGDECSTCTQVADEVIALLKNAEIDSLVKSAITEVCTLLPIPNCAATLDQYFDEIVALIKNLDGKTLCSIIGLCGSETTSLHTPAPKLGGIMCSTCETVMDTMIGYLSDDSLVSEIKVVVTDVCAVVPIANCKQILDQYVDELVGMIKNMDGKTLCEAMGMCLAGTKTELPKLPVPNVGDECSTCTQVADEVIALLENAEIDSLVKSAITEVCTLLPIPNCAATLDGYFDEIVALIKNLDGKTLCSIIGLCGSETTSLHTPAPKLGGIMCSTCETVMGTMIGYLSDDSLVKEIKVVVTDVCAVVPIPNCQQILDQYVDELVQTIKSMDGKTLCEAMGMCSAGTKVELPKLPVLKLGDSCSMCTSVADEVLALIKNQQIDSLVKEAITEVCGLLPIPNCAATLDQYFDEIVAMIKNLDGKTLCSIIGLCGSESTIYNAVEWY